VIPPERYRSLGELLLDSMLQFKTETALLELSRKRTAHELSYLQTKREADALAPATTLDLFAEIALTQRLAIVLRGENLFDEDIITRNSGGAIDLGAPRTIWAGVRVGL